MADVPIKQTTSLGAAVTTAAGHAGEMAGRAMQRASQVVGCTVGQTVGKAVEAAGRAVADTGVTVANRDSARLTGKRR